MGSVVIMPAGYCSSLEQASILENIRAVNMREIQERSFIPDEVKKTLSLKHRCILTKPDMSRDLAFIVLQDCTALFHTIGLYLETKFRKSQKNASVVLKEQTNFLQENGMEVLWFIHNLSLYAANVYYDGIIPEGILDIRASCVENIPEKYLPHLVYLKTNAGSVFLVLPSLENEKISTSYMRVISMVGDKTLKQIDFLYNGKNAIHEDGFYINLDDSRQYAFNLSGYLGKPHYKMWSETIAIYDEFIPDLQKKLKNPILCFVIQELCHKIGGIENLKKEYDIGELLFLSLPLSSKDQEESTYAEDLFQAKKAIQFLKAATFLLEKTSVNGEDKNINAENEEKRKQILERKKNMEERLSRLAKEYQTSSEALIATIEGKLLTLNEAEYKRQIEIDQEKIRKQLHKRSNPGVMKGKRSKQQKKSQKIIDESNQELQKKLDQSINKIRTDFLESISNRHKDRRFVLEKFHQYLQKNNISFYEKQSGSHKVTHTEGASPITVVEEHKGTAEFSGSTIRKMLKVYGDALSCKIEIKKGLTV